MKRKLAIWCFVCIMAAEIAGSVVYTMAAGTVHFLNGFLPQLIFSQMMLLLPMLAFAMLTPAPFSRMFPFKRLKFSSLCLAALATVLIYPAILVINLLTLLITYNRAADIGAGALALPMWLSILLIGGLGPLCEELVFRGYLLQNLSPGARSIGACIISALMFGVAHGNLNQGMYAFFFGVFLALLARAAGSLTAGFLSHAMFNTFEVILMYSVDTSAIEAASGQSLVDILQANGISGSQWTVVVAGFMFFAVIAILLCVAAFFLISLIGRIEGTKKRLVQNM